MICDEYRLNYYLGNANRQYKLHHAGAKEFSSGRYHTINRHNLVKLFEIKHNLNLPDYYITDLLDVYNKLPPVYHDEYITYFPADVDCRLKHQSIVKSRLIGDDLGTLLKLEKDRHFELGNSMSLNNVDTVKTINSMDIPFLDKCSNVVYRGTVGPCMPLFNWYVRYGFRKSRRLTLIKKFSDHPMFDIGATDFSDVFGLRVDDLLKYKRHKLTIEQMLTYRYIISVEGNDLASNLKWAMLSNSVVMMPKPTTCSWFMEDHLKPYVHYVPLKPNFSNLDKQFRWCESNVTKCEQIAKDSTKYARQFYNHLNETRLNKEVLKLYINNAV